MKIDLKCRNKKKSLEVQRLGLFEMIRGLMFCRGRTASALLFDFKKSTNVSIHSFFCPRFFAVWLDEKNNILEIRKVSSGKFSILPEKSFVKLVEIPCNDKYDDILKFLVDDCKDLNR